MGGRLRLESVATLVWNTHLGFDVSKIPEFTSEEWAFIPAQSGNVIYTATMPTHPPISTDSHSIESSESLSLETRQRAFLFKGADWALEEEVRIVKFLRGYERFFDVIYLGDRPLYFYEIPSDSLVEVHLGCRAKVLPATNGEHCNWLRLKKAMKTFESCRLFHIDVDLNSWEVTSRESSQWLMMAIGNFTLTEEHWIGV
tara:strand:+ start:186 stop:785 length:600 start_codon:yes stop_codon:yes gene_type:complete